MREVELVITRGLPRSGKSTFALEWVADAPFRARVNRDEVRFTLFGKYVLDRFGEETTTMVQQTAVKRLLVAGTSVIVDDTNLRAQTVKDWMKIAKECGASFSVVDFNTDVEECIRRDNAEKEKGSRYVGEDVIRNYAQRYLRKGQLPRLPDEDRIDEERRVYVRDETRPGAYLVDIDGTLARMNGRGPFEWHRVHEDLPIDDVVEMVKALDTAGYRIIFMSGRDEACREGTRRWLAQHLGQIGFDAPMFMRPAGDMRRDSIVKHELFWKHVADKYCVVGVIDDRQQVVDMWREIGLTVFQCAKGDF